MAERKRTQFQRENDYVRISEWYLRGWRQLDIAAELGLSFQQISYDIKTIQRRWREKTAINLDQAKSRELERIDLLEREYWAAWERSKTEKTKAKRELSGKDTNGDPIVRRQFSEKEQMIGNPAYLNGVQWCISERCKLIGIYAPVRSEIGGSINGRIEHEITGGIDLKLLTTEELLAYRQLTEKASTEISLAEDDYSLVEVQE